MSEAPESTAAVPLRRTSWRWRSMLLRGLALLVIGFIITILVAWGCTTMLRPGMLSSGSANEHATGTFWQVSADRQPGRLWIRSSRSRRPKGPAPGVDETPLPRPADLAPHWAGLHQMLPETAAPDDPMALERRTVLAGGWPYLCLWCEWRHTQPYPFSGAPVKLETIGCIEMPLRPWPTRPVPKRRDLPLLPIPRGLVLNTLFYAAVSGLLWWGVPFSRRWIRRRRGCRPGCGYDLRGRASADRPCPECGYGGVSGADSRPVNNDEAPRVSPNG